MEQGRSERESEIIEAGLREAQQNITSKVMAGRQSTTIFRDAIRCVGAMQFPPLLSLSEKASHTGKRRLHRL